MIPTWGAAFGANAIFNSAEFRADLTHSAVPDKAAPGTTGTFTRATTSTWPNNDGYMVTGVAGEIGFVGARRVHNKLAVPTEDFDDAGWGKLAAGAGTLPAVTAGFTAPDGTATAWRLQANAGGVGAGDYSFLRASAPNATLRTIYIKSNTASPQEVHFGLNTGSDVVTATTEWQRLSAVYTGVGSLFDIGVRAVASGSSNTVVDVLIWHPQAEDVTAQTTQTAGEYVSVGVESAPYYHGSFVDGVKCFPTDLSGNPLPTQYTYDAVSLNGVAGTYVSTPDSVAASVTGSSRFEWVGSIYDYNMTNTLLSKWNVGSYLLRISAAKKVLFNANGTNSVSITSTASVPFNNGDDNIGVKVEVVADNGAGGSTTSIYTTIDGGETWDLLESATVTAGVLSIADTTDAVMVGNYGTTSGQLAGKTYRARIYNNSTLAVDFDASRYAGGTTLTGSTGETWTLQGNAVIHPTNSPLLGYQAQGARTNLCTKSQEFDAWTVGSAGAGSNPVVTANAGTAPDGTATADKVVFSAPSAGDLSVITSPAFATVAASVYTSAVYVKAFAAGDVGKQLLTRQAGASGYTAITLSADWQRLGTTETAAGVSTTFDILLRPTFGGSSGTVSCYLWGAQVELGSFASSYIATTTVAVTRDPDILTYSSGDVPNLKTLHAGFNYPAVVDVATNYTILDLDDGDYLTNSVVLRVLGDTLKMQAFTFSGGVTQVLHLHANVLDTSNHKCSMAVVTNSAISEVDGNDPKTTGASLAPVGLASLRVGYNSTGGQLLNGPVNHIYGWTRNLSQSELGAIDA